MDVSLFDYELPESLIAKYPPTHRDQSRLLILDRKSQDLSDRAFPDILDYLDEGDVLVINETKVIPARLRGTRTSTGAAIEIFLVQPTDVPDQWRVLARPAKKVRVGETIHFAEGFEAHIVEELTEGERVAQFISENGLYEALDKHGEVPLPVYLHRDPEASDKERYQTIFAKHPGAVAAPTAGLHFTDAIFERASRKGVSIARITLHTGLGTFRPVEVQNVQEHMMHSEFYEVTEEASETINSARNRGGKIVAVGTTSVRTLETIGSPNGTITASHGLTDIFIYPGYRFKVVDRMLTNFHMPRSTLLMMISAFADRDFVLRAYRHAIEKKYRFFSYGDAMLIL